ncbi:MAG: alkaline phosphatase family protein [Deinococcales bacterium]
MPLAKHLLEPDYDGSSIINVTASIAAHFGVPTLASPLRQALPLAGIENIVLFIVDGFGQWQLEKHLADGDTPNLKTLLEQSQKHTLTSVFPSTTMSAITGIHMAASPAQTGWLGYTMWLEEVKRVVEMIGQVDFATREKLEQPDFLKVTTGIYGALEQRGVRVHSIAPFEYRGTWLNEWYWQGAVQYGYLTANTAPSIVKNSLTLEGQPKLVVLYFADYDTVCHRYGPSSQSAADEISAIDHVLGRVLRQIPKDGKTLFLLTADHGQRDLSDKKAIYLEQDYALMAMLEGAPAGDRVARTLRVKPKYLDAARERLAQHSDTILAKDAWEIGLFGGSPALNSFYARVGNLIALAHTETQLCYTYPNKHPSRPHRGSHGGLSQEEMLVPLVVSRF